MKKRISRMTNFNPFFIFFVLVLIPLISNAQISDELDVKNGFKHFKLGKSVSELKNDLKYLGELPSKESLYEYTGEDIKDVADVAFDNMHLYFYKDKLVMIEFEFGKALEDYSRLCDNLKIAFGEPYHVITTFDNHEQLFFANQWLGKKVVMSAFQYNLNNIEEYQKRVFLEIKIKDKEKKIMLDKF